MEDEIDLTLLIPAHDEAQNLPGLIDEIFAALPDRNFELIVVDDGSGDDTAAVFADLAGRRATSSQRMMLLGHADSCGKSRALASGLRQARGRIVVTLDGDGQNDPAAIPQLLDALERAGDGVVMAAGRRMGRTDGPAKKHASRLANRIRQWLLEDNASDSGCGLKAIRRDVYLTLPTFDNAHRFMPALVRREGFAFVEVDIVDRRRQFGRSKYGLFDRASASLLDLFGVWWLNRRARNLPQVTKIWPGN